MTKSEQEINEEESLSEEVTNKQIDEKVNVSPIMDYINIEVERKKREIPGYPEDIAVVNNISFNPSTNNNIGGIDSDSVLNFVNYNYSLPTLDTVKSKKSVIGKVVNKLRERIRVEVSYLMNPVIKKQEEFNANVAFLCNHLLRSPELKINQQQFETKFKGSSEDIKKRNEPFLQYFKKGEKVLHVGCGQGFFIEQLQESGCRAYGIDINERAVNECLQKKLNVVNIDTITHLKSMPSESLDGIYFDPILERLSKADIIEVIELAHRKLKRRGVVIFTAVNITTLNNLTNSFHLDLHNITPLHPHTLVFLCEMAGYTNVNLSFHSFPHPHEQLEQVSDQVMNKNIEKLNKLLFGAKNYAVVCHK